METTVDLYKLDEETVAYILSWENIMFRMCVVYKGYCIHMTPRYTTEKEAHLSITEYCRRLNEAS